MRTRSTGRARSRTRSTSTSSACAEAMRGSASGAPSSNGRPSTHERRAGGSFGSTVPRATPVSGPTTNTPDSCIEATSSWESEAFTRRCTSATWGPETRTAKPPRLVHGTFTRWGEHSIQEFVERRFDMRRTMWIGALLLAILVGVVVGVTSYHAGVTHGLEQAGHASQVVRVVGPGYGYGYFPFGFLLFPLFLFGIFFLVRGAFWRRRW